MNQDRSIGLWRTDKNAHLSSANGRIRFVKSPRYIVTGMPVAPKELSSEAQPSRFHDVNGCAQQYSRDASVNVCEMHVTPEVASSSSSATPIRLFLWTTRRLDNDNPDQ
jgi:hypothetical protein